MLCVCECVLGGVSGLLRFCFLSKWEDKHCYHTSLVQPGFSKTYYYVNGGKCIGVGKLCYCSDVISFFPSVCLSPCPSPRALRWQQTCRVSHKKYRQKKKKNLLELFECMCVRKVVFFLPGAVWMLSFKEFYHCLVKASIWSFFLKVGPQLFNVSPQTESAFN